MEQHACPTCGSCSGMFTANSMNCLCEALGLALPGQRHASWRPTPERDELFKAAGRRDRGAGREGHHARGDILTARGHRQRLRAGHGDGRLHQHRAAHAGHRHRGGQSTTRWSASTRSRRRAAHLQGRARASKYHMEDVDRAGGISAILKTLAGKPGTLHLDCITVTGKTLGENIADAEVKDADVIRPLEEPTAQKGGLAVLFGNLAPDGRGPQDRRRATRACTRSRGPGGHLRDRGRGRWQGILDGQGEGRATWWSSATKARAAARACRRCWRPQRTSSGGVWARASP